MSEKGYEYLDHKSDVQVRCWAPNLKEAFSQAALSLIDTITEVKNIEKRTSKTIQVTSEDIEALLFDFLSELLYLFDTEDLVFKEIEIKQLDEQEDGYILVADLTGEVFDPEKHGIGTEVKAITFSYMVIEEKEDKTIIEVIFDI